MNQGTLNHHLSQGYSVHPNVSGQYYCQDIVNVSSGFCYVRISWLRHWNSGFFPCTRLYHPSLYYLQRISCSPLWNYNRLKGWRQDTAEWLVVGALLRVREEHGLVCGNAWSDGPSTRNVAYRGISTESRLKWPFSSAKKAVWSVCSCDHHTSEGSTCKQYKIVYY